jgi:hypothetical protein
MKIKNNKNHNTKNNIKTTIPKNNIKYIIELSVHGKKFRAN